MSETPADARRRAATGAGGRRAGAAAGRCAERRAARRLPARRRHRRHAADHDALRVLHRRPRRARATGHKPALDLPGDLQRHRPELVLPVAHSAAVHERRRFPCGDEQPPADAASVSLVTPLILTGLAVAFAFRCGMFNIGGQGQYLVGTLAAVWLGSSLPGCPAPLHILLCDRRRGARGRALGRDRRLPEGDRRARTR